MQDQITEVSAIFVCNFKLSFEKIPCLTNAYYILISCQVLCFLCPLLPTLLKPVILVKLLAMNCPCVKLIVNLFKLTYSLCDDG